VEEITLEYAKRLGTVPTEYLRDMIQEMYKFDGDTGKRRMPLLLQQTPISTLSRSSARTFDFAPPLPHFPHCCLEQLPDHLVIHFR
jgi:hypothetical protein